MAESEGFEPPIALRRCLISSQVHSTGLCQLSAIKLHKSILQPDTSSQFSCGKFGFDGDSSSLGESGISLTTALAKGSPAGHDP
jgi:hypothetical protein